MRGPSRTQSIRVITVRNWTPVNKCVALLLSSVAYPLSLTPVFLWSCEANLKRARRIERGKNAEKAAGAKPKLKILIKEPDRVGKACMAVIGMCFTQSRSLIIGSSVLLLWSYLCQGEKQGNGTLLLRPKKRGHIMLCALSNNHSSCSYVVANIATAASSAH